MCDFWRAQEATKSLIFFTRGHWVCTLARVPKVSDSNFRVAFENADVPMKNTDAVDGLAGSQNCFTMFRPSL